LAAAERRNAQADDALSPRQADLTAARRRHHEALRNLHRAERDLNTAERAYDHGKTASRDGAEMLTEVNKRLSGLARKFVGGHAARG